MFLKNNSVLLGIVWFTASLFIGIVNDSITKYLGRSLSIHQIVFMRFLFSFITLTPVILITGINQLKTNNIKLHIIRGGLLFIAISLWSASFQYVPITTVTAIGFTMPLYILILSAVFLKERVSINRLLATIVGFIGVFLVLNPESTNAYFALTFLVLASLCFASLDIINKKYISTESTLSMMFYSALITTTLGWINITSELKYLEYTELTLLFMLGSGANLLLYCLLQAFKYVDASFLSPFRYLELVFSILSSYFLFNELISLNVLFGAFVIIISVVWVTYNEQSKKLIISRKFLKNYKNTRRK
jgi:S-adenosylmethionine uptake transporter